METRANYALIGAFTLAVIASAFGFVLWFSGGNQSADRKIYRMVFTSSVSGLSQGATVLFNGLKVGEVTSIGLAADDPRVVNAMISVDPRTPIKTDTRARLESVGLTGVASVALNGGTASAQPVVAGPDGAPPTIYAEPSELQNIIDTLQGLSGKIDGLVTRADQLVDSNSQSITNTFKNVEKVTQAVADSSDAIRDTLSNLDDVSRGVKPFADTLNRNAGAIDDIVRNTKELTAKLDTSANKLDGLLGSAQGVLNQPGVKTMFGDIGDASRSIRKLADNLDKVVGPGVRSINSVAADGQRAIDQVNRTVRSLQRNPQQFIFGAKPDVPEYSPQ